MKFFLEEDIEYIFKFLRKKTKKLEGKKIRYYHFFNVIKEILLRRFL